MVCRKQNRIVSLTIALVFSFSIILPATIAKVYPECKKSQCLLTLDVCHGMGNGVLSDSDAPFLSECPCTPVSLSLAGFRYILNPAFNPFISVSQLERPPIV